MLRTDVRDPRLEGVGLSEVEVTRDIGVARVYYVTPDDADHEAIEQALQKAAGYLRSQAGRALRMRAVPELRFHRDDSLNTGARVEALLAQSRNRSD